MTRDEYIAIRKDIAHVLYEYYREHFDDKKHRPLLHPAEFFKYITHWGHADFAIEKALTHYDAKFEVLIAKDQHGNIISVS